MASTPTMPTPTPIPADAPVERPEEGVLVGDVVEVELADMEADDDELSVIGVDVAVEDEFTGVEDVDVVLEYVVSWTGVSCQRLKTCNLWFGDEPILGIDYWKAT